MTAVGIVSPGDMGQAVGSLLATNGVRVLVTLDGRSGRTRALAAAAGFATVADMRELSRECDLILSIVPPAAAVHVARAIAAAPTGGRGPLVADCNAIAPRTVRAVASVIASSGATCVDVGIVGGPPRGAPSPRFYVSGPERARFAALVGGVLDVRVLGEAIGEASAVKMCYAALTKGTTAVATALLVAADRMGVYDTVVDAIGESPELARRLTAVATMPAKAHRWVAEMEEIAMSFADVGLTPKLFDGAADVYRLTAASPIGSERPETLDRSRGLERTVAAIAGTKRHDD